MPPEPGSASDAAASFEPLRGSLIGLAYRMLGSRAEAEDVVQDAYLRWHAADRIAVREPRAFLSKAVTRLCLDLLKSARHRREDYVGSWLPEPVLDTGALSAGGAGEYAEDLSVALLLALERLSPLERAAFLLHDVFDMSFDEVADSLGRDAAACRQLASRARSHVRQEKPRFQPTPEEEAKVFDAFSRALGSGDLAGLVAVLAQDAALYADGGGKATAVSRPLFGGERIAKFFAGLMRARWSPHFTLRAARVNGLPGLMALEGDAVVQTMALEVREGRIAAVYVTRNPDKLRHLH